jgi:hypothetical protein
LKERSFQRTSYVLGVNILHQTSKKLFSRMVDYDK